MEVKRKLSEKKKTHGIDQWKALITSFLMQSFILGTLESYGALYVPIMDDVLVRESQKGTKSALIGSLTTGFLMGFSPISSYLIDRVGAQLIALFGGVIVFLATLTTSFVDTFIPMALFYGVMFGIGCSMLFISSNVVISRYFEENSTLAYGILGFGNGLMNSIMPHVISYSVGTIKVAGTIRIISFLLSFNMFFPLYWNSDKREDNEEATIGYLPTKLVSKFTQLREDARISQIVALSELNIKNNQNIENSNYRFRKAKKKSVNSNINILNKTKSKFLSSKMSRYDYHFRNINLSNIESPTPLFSIKRDKMSEDIHNDISGKFKTADPLNYSDYGFPEAALFKKGLTSRSSSSLDDDFFIKFTKKSSFSSVKTKDTFRSVFKNIKCCQAEIFQSKPYVTLLIAMPIAMLGYQVPNVHIVKFAQKVAAGMNGQLLLTCLGAASAIGPFINGLILEKIQCKISKYRLYQVFVLAYGMVILILPLMTKFYALIIICLVIGFLDGSFSSLLGPLTIDLVGVHRAGQAIGTFYGVIALSVIIAPPLAGFLYDYSSTYEFAFYPAGLFFLIGGLVLSVSHTTPKDNTGETPGDFTTNIYNKDTSEVSEVYDSTVPSDPPVIQAPLFQR